MTTPSGSAPPRLNPFRTSRVHSLRFRFDDRLHAGSPDDELTALWRRFETLGRRSALVGPEGSGKSTLLQRLEALFEEKHARPGAVLRLCLHAERRDLDAAEWQAVKAADGSKLITVDGAEQMPRFSWWRLRWTSRRSAGLLITAHRPGLLPTLRVHRTSAALLHRLVDEATNGRTLPFAVDLDALFVSHSGNLRDCLAELYDRWAASGRE